MLVTYIYHSCYVVELERHILLFDYYQGELPTFDPKKKLYIFASHAHEDHYSDTIFQIEHPDITYVLSDDIHAHDPLVHYVAAHETYHVDDVVIETLASTDEGVAFFVEVEHTRIYYAGDLNWWDWGAEDTLEEGQQMKQNYQSEIDRLAHKSMDIAFLVVDARLQKRCVKGLDAFLKTCDAKVIFPMHMWNSEFVHDQLKRYTDYRKRIQNVHKRGQCFLIELS